MYKWGQTLRIIGAVAWAVVFVITIVKPKFDTRLPLLITTALLVFMNLADFMMEREEHVREAKRPDDQP